MTDGQWFEVGLALGQTVVGVAATVLAVYLAAATALRHDRRRAVTERSRGSAEKLLAVTQTNRERLLMFHGHVNFVLQPAPAQLDDPRLAEAIDVAELAERVVQDFHRVKLEGGLLEHEELRQQFDWAVACAVEFSLIVAAVTHQPQRFTAEEVAANAGHAAEFLGEFEVSLRAYMMNAERAEVSKPTYWLTPVKDL